MSGFTVYYFNDEIPTDEDFEKAIADYLTFQLDMVSLGGYLTPLQLFEIILLHSTRERLKRSIRQQGTIPYVSSSALNNGVDLLG